MRGRYASLLSSWSGGIEHPGAIRIIVSGTVTHSADVRGRMHSEALRYAAYDGTLSDLGNGPHPAIAPLVNARWASVPAAQRKNLRDVVVQAHAHNQQVRFWDTPEPGNRLFGSRAYRKVWRRELNVGVDWLNTDHLGTLEDFLK